MCEILLVHLISVHIHDCTCVYTVHVYRNRLCMVVQAMGGGYELDEAYPNMDFCFLDIGNIHVMRDRCVGILYTCPAWTMYMYLLSISVHKYVHE